MFGSLSNRAIKVVLVGETGVGKTSLVTRMQTGVFGERCPTVGARFSAMIDARRNLAIHFWDTAGRSQFHDMIPQYLKGASVVLVCIESTDDIGTRSDKYRKMVLACEPTARIIYVVMKSDEVRESGSGPVAVSRITSAYSGEGVESLKELLFSTPPKGTAASDPPSSDELSSSWMRVGCRLV